MSEIDPEMLEVFREEAAERLDRIERDAAGARVGRRRRRRDRLALPRRPLDQGQRRDGRHGGGSVARAQRSRTSSRACASAALPAELADPLLRATDELGRRGLRRSATATRRDRTGATTVAEPRSSRRRPSAVAARCSPDKVDRLLDAVGETVLHHRRLEHLLDDGGADDERIDGELDHGETLLDELQDSVIEMRTLPLELDHRRLSRAPFATSPAADGKEVELEITGAETAARPRDPRGHRRVDHPPPAQRGRPRHRGAGGRERAGKPRARPHRAARRAARQPGGDRGRRRRPRRRPSSSSRGRRRTGSLADMLAEAGFSTAERGRRRRRPRGRPRRRQGPRRVARRRRSRSTASPDEGTTSCMLLPLTLALLRVLVLERGGQMFGIPLTSVEEVDRGRRDAVARRPPGARAPRRSVRLADLAELARRPRRRSCTSAPRRVIVARRGGAWRPPATGSSGSRRSSSRASARCSPACPATSAQRSWATAGWR